MVGGFATTWRGTAFHCLGRGNQIILLHTQFNESGEAMEECNGGNIIGHSRSRTFDGFADSKFTSQLTIHLPLLNPTSSTLEGETVACARSAENVINIGTHTIAYTRNSSGTYRSMCFIMNNGTHNSVKFYYCVAPPPDNVHLAQVTKNALTFQWDPVQSICSYKVNAEGCGVCPNTTLNTSVTCVVNDILVNSASNNSVCTLSVETMVCGFQSNVSEVVTATLKGIS